MGETAQVQIREEPAIRRPGETADSPLSGTKPVISVILALYNYEERVTSTLDALTCVLEQVERPKFVVADTMNFWIERKPRALAELLRRADVAVINDEEARMLSGHASLSAAARAIRGMGPRWVVIKQGEYGALMFSDHGVFLSLIHI